MPPDCRARSRTFVVVLAAILAAGCAVNAGRPAMETTVPDPDRDAGPELMAADRAFAAAVAAAAGPARAEVWAGWFAPDGRQFVPGAVLAGREAVAGLMAPAFDDPGYSLQWEPDLAAGAGRWGWTSGRYVSTRPGPQGLARSEGRYLTVWQRQADGSWKVAVDAGVPDPK